MKYRIKLIKIDADGACKRIAGEPHVVEVYEVYKNGQELWIADFRSEKLAGTFVAMMELSWR